MKNFLQADEVLVAQKGHAAYKLNELINLYFNATTDKQVEAAKARVIAFRIGTYETGTIRDAFTMFPIKDCLIMQNIKEDFLSWLKKAEEANS